MLSAFTISLSIYAYVVVASASTPLVGRAFWLGGGFSRARFYALMGWVPLAYLSLSVLFDARYAAFFFVAAALGMLGELLVSIAYARFFGAPIWRYSYGAIARGYTSRLNVLPWAFGALLFQQAGRLSGLAPAPETAWRTSLIGGAALVLGCAALWPMRRFTAAARGRFSGRGFLVFSAPIAFVFVAVGVFADLRYLPLMAIYAVVGFAAEYAYGRTIGVFFDRPFWLYTHSRLDGGHTSLVTLPLWALGGLYFQLIAATLGL